MGYLNGLYKNFIHLDKLTYKHSWKLGNLILNGCTMNILDKTFAPMLYFDDRFAHQNCCGSQLDFRLISIYLIILHYLYLLLQ